MRILEDAVSSNNEGLVVLGIVIVALAIVAIVASFIFETRSTDKNRKVVKKMATSMRVYKVDLLNDNVLYFNRSNLRKKKNVSVAEFYKHFIDVDRERVQEWVMDLFDANKDTPNFIEANIVGKAHQKFFSFLQVQKIDLIKKVVFIDSYLLKYMSSSRNRGFDSKHFLNKESFAKVLTTGIVNKGITFGVNFYSKLNNGDVISKLAFSQIQNVLSYFINVNRPMLSYDEHQIVISDLKAIGKQKQIQIVNTIKAEINRFLLLNSLENEIGYSIGVIENKFFQDDIEGLLQNCLKVARLAREEKSGLIVYEEGYKFTEAHDAEHYRTEVERIIQDKKIRYFFQPIYHVGKNRTLGYSSSSEPIDSFFETIDELKKYAIRTEDDRELFATITKNVITRFVEQKTANNLRLFLPITVNELEYANRIFSYIDRIKDIHIVLVIQESDIMNIIENASEAFINNVRNIKSKGYEVALQLDDSELTLSPTIYEIFDFYMISIISHINDKTQSRQLPSLRGLIEKLLRYRKDIIAIDVPSWDYVELVVKSGIEIVSSEAIGPKDQNVLPLPKKSVTKLASID